jgi:hypothetical protein
MTSITLSDFENPKHQQNSHSGEFSRLLVTFIFLCDFLLRLTFSKTFRPMEFEKHFTFFKAIIDILWQYTVSWVSTKFRNFSRLPTDLRLTLATCDNTFDDNLSTFLQLFSNFGDSYPILLQSLCESNSKVVSLCLSPEDHSSNFLDTSVSTSIRLALICEYFAFWFQLSVSKHHDQSNANTILAFGNSGSGRRRRRSLRLDEWNMHKISHAWMTSVTKFGEWKMTDYESSSAGVYSSLVTGGLRHSSKPTNVLFDHFPSAYKLPVSFTFPIMLH